ncbi:MAG: MazG-like family protein [Firmicutes bacterium]|nr:MazG-like family protein [Bacillota bacterium]
MSSNNPDFNIVKNVRIIEWLKAELVTGLGALFKAMIKNNEDAILDSLTWLITGCYFLGKRLGFSYAKIDAKIEQKLLSPQMQEHEIEEWYGDASNLHCYFKERNP